MGTIFKVTGGGRIYVAAMKVLSANTVVLDVTGSDLTSGFYHIGGMKTDAQAEGMVLLHNDDSGDGTVYVRFTDAHFVVGDVSATIDGSDSTTGQTVLEVIRCKAVSVLADNVIRIVQPAGSPVSAGKVWFPSIMIEDCATGIKTEGTVNAGDCAFGYLWPHDCDTVLRLDNPQSTMFTFRYVHPLSCGTVFNVTDGGRIYVHAINVVSENVTILDVSAGDMNNSFFHINNMKVDGGIQSFHVLKNEDTGNGLTVVRFTDAHFASGQSNTAHVDINRSASSSGKTVLEFVGCNYVEKAGEGLATRVVVKGASVSHPSRLIVRDSMLARFPGTPAVSQLIKEPDSSNYPENRVKNWTIGGGIQPDESQSG